MQRLVNQSSLPEYIVADIFNLSATDHTAIRRIATPVYFPLSAEDRKDMKLLSDKFDSEINMAGLAAPQIGISKRFFTFTVSEETAKNQNCQAFPKSLWINPSYERVNHEVEIEYEQCFSVKDYVGPVMRYKSIFYKAQDMDGNPVEGRADGFAARVIQHEIDHLDGILFVDLVSKDKLMLYNDYVDKVALLKQYGS